MVYLASLRICYTFGSFPSITLYKVGILDCSLVLDKKFILIQ